MKTINIVQLYPKEMNIYGDNGNILILCNRLKWRNIPYKVYHVGINDTLPESADILVGGGGQDSGQQLIEKDLLKRKHVLESMALDGVVMLMICGMYQLFGNEFITSNQNIIKGIGILPVSTHAQADRFVGNIVIDSEFGEMVGYENHSGRTILESGCQPLGRVVKGRGNNGDDGTEGARKLNVFGSYMHGPILSKNPVFADKLLSLSADRKGYNLVQLDDDLEKTASKYAIRRP